MDTSPPDPEKRAGVDRMSRRDRAYACWLALRAGFPLVRSTWGVVPETGQVVVDIPRVGVTFAMAAGTEELILAAIEFRFGQDARRRVEGGIGG